MGFKVGVAEKGLATGVADDDRMGGHVGDHSVTIVKGQPAESAVPVLVVIVDKAVAPKVARVAEGTQTDIARVDALSGMDAQMTTQV